MRNTAFLLGLLACAVSSSATAAPVLRQPTGKWVLDYGETACTVYRNYGSEQSPIVLAFRPSPNGSVVRVSLLRDGGGTTARHFPIWSNILGEAQKTTALRFPSAGGKKETIWINFARSQLEALPQVGELAFAARGLIDERFALPSMSAVLKGLDTCNADLRHHWNIGGVSAVATQATPSKSPGSWVNNDDYPQQALDEGASGIVQFVLLIDGDGKVRDCMVEETSGVASLDAMACLLLRERAKFKPAVDASGKPVRSSWTNRFRWVR